jgi:hypothetical protein
MASAFTTKNTKLTDALFRETRKSSAFSVDSVVKAPMAAETLGTGLR